MNATLRFSDVELEEDEFLRITDEVTRQLKLEKPRTVHVKGVPGWTANEEIRVAINKAVEVRRSMFDDVQAYMRARGINGKYAYGAHSRLYLVFPPYPVRISPVETFAIPPTVSLVFPHGSELWLDELEGNYEVDTLFRMVNDDGIASSMRRDIWRPVIKCPELPVDAFKFVDNQCNLTVHQPVIYGCRSAFEFDAWHTDTRIYGGHIENCQIGVGGPGGHNCHIYGSSFLTCGTAINLVNAQSLHIRGNVFSQENSVLSAVNPIAVQAQGKNIVVSGNSIRDHKQCLLGNIYGGSFSDNYISYSRDEIIPNGWLARLDQWKGEVGGTNWEHETQGKVKPSIMVQGNIVHRDDGQQLPNPGIHYERGTIVHDILNRTPDGGWVKKAEVEG